MDMEDLLRAKMKNLNIHTYEGKFILEWMLLRIQSFN